MKETIFGETYEEVRGLGNVLWRGDLLVFEKSSDEDARVYMLYLDPDRNGFYLINYVGYKAGATLSTFIPMTAARNNEYNVRLKWLRENWGKYIPLTLGSFEDTRFLRWRPND